MTITRRDFLNGMALTVAAGLTPAMQIAADPLLYPPALTGLRGQHDGSFEIAHALAREGRAFPHEGLACEEDYDLVVVGGGISGLAAAYYYALERPRARILVLDNHDDFGGHAKRNEFRFGDRLVLGYGGSETFQSPQGLWSATAKQLLADLGVDLGRFETAFDRTLYPKLGLSRGVFFAQEAFGRDALVTGDPMVGVASDLTPEELNAKPVTEFVQAFPVSAESKAQLLRLYADEEDFLPGKSPEEKTALLESTSYRDYLTKFCGLSEEAANCFQGRTLDFFALGIDALPASYAQEAGWPGFSGLGLEAEANPEAEEPYIHHFPDGNASLARLLVQALIPSVAKGFGMEDIVLAPFYYGRLDQAGQRTRIRLNATVVHVADGAEAADVTYWRDGGLHKVGAKHVVLACFNMIIPHIAPGLPDAQKQALAQNVKAPLVYNKVWVRDWKPWVALGVSEISAPMSFHSTVKLDYPVSLGGYACPREPSEPMCVHMVHVPSEPGSGLTAREQFRAGRQTLLEMSFADFEARIRDELGRMLGPGGFDAARDIAGITVNRWSHGYSYEENTLFDQDAAATVAAAKTRAGRLAIANSDAAWSPYAHAAIDEAHRAVRELLDG